MKKYLFTKQINSLIVFVFIIFSTVESKSQYVITFTDGTEVKANITYQTKDTVKYYLDSKPDVVYGVTMAQIQRIRRLEPLTVNHPDTLPNLQNNKEYLHYKHMTTNGIILLSSGAVIGVVGTVGYLSTGDHVSTFDSFTGTIFSMVGIGLGSALFLTGAVVTIVGSVNMQQCQEKLHGFSFDLKYTPQVKGITVAYRF